VAETTHVQEQVYRDEEWYAQDLTGRRYVDCTFRDVDLTEATGRGVAFESCTFEGCRFNACELESAAFVGCDVRRTSFFGATLAGASWPARSSSTARSGRSRSPAARCHDARREPLQA
jgi:uncharacterized protein YjbI with pentapeptide repeats